MSAISRCNERTSTETRALVVNVSVPDSVDADMTKSVLEEHGVGASASLVRTISPHCRPQYMFM